MAEYLHIHSEGFHADLRLDRLELLPRPAFRKLLRIMRHSSDENRGALGLLSYYLSQHVENTKQDWEKASRDYQNGWRFVDKQSRSKESQAIRKENRRLKTAVKRAKGAYDTAVALQIIFNKEIN